MPTRNPFPAAALGLAAALTSLAGAGDELPPGPVTDLRLHGLDSPGLRYDRETRTLEGPEPFLLVWSAPGDDGDEGRAWRTEARFAPGDVDEASWEAAVPLTHLLDAEPPPAPGLPDTVAIGCFRGLVPGAGYAIRIRVFDEAGNAGPLSNPVVVSVPGDAPSFAESVPLDGVEFWAWGVPIRGPTLTVRYEGSVLSLNGVAPHTRFHIFPVLDHLAARYGGAPSVREWVEAGADTLEAVRRFHWESGDLLRRAGRVSFEAGLDPALDLLRASPLVERVVHLEASTVEIAFRGVERRAVENLAWNPEPACFTFQADTTSAGSARSLADWVIRTVAEEGTGPRIVLLAGSGVLSLTRPGEISGFRSQIDFLRRHRTVDGLPEGPLAPATAREFLDAQR